MQDIITILQNIVSGMDGIAVRGMEDREMLTSCVKGLRVAIGALEGIQTAQAGAPAASTQEDVDEGVNENGG